MKGLLQTDHALEATGDSLEESAIGDFVKLLNEGRVMLGCRGRVHHGI